MGAPDDLEPTLPLDEIQGGILPGFNKRCQQVVGLKITDIAGAKRWIAAIAPEITSATEVQRFKELRRALRDRRGTAPTGIASAWMSIAFSAPALRRLASDADVDEFEDDAFKVGLAKRAGAIGDPHAGMPGAPDGWEIGGSDATTADVLLVLAADVPDMLAFHRNRLDETIAAMLPAVEVFFEQDGRDLPDGLRGHEHFGFRDGISQPGVRGRLPWGVDEFLTPRRLAPEDPEASEFAKPGQPLVRVGQFLFGYAAQNRHVPTDAARPRDAPAWAANGSFLVFRRLEQDVAAFRAFVAAKAAELGGVSEERFAALLVGRWPSGAPLMRAPTADDPALAADELAANAFQFAEGSRGGDDPFPPAPADLDGARCPIWAHVRKVNPRDVTTEQGSDTDTLSRRILRRGIPYGDPFDRPGPRGLLFISYQTSITDQFEFLASSWMNATDKPQSGAADGHDILVGQNPARDAQRVCTAVLRTEDGPLRSFTTSGAPWVFATGGGYFFAPSLPALTGVIAA